MFNGKNSVKKVSESPIENPEESQLFKAIEGVSKLEQKREELNARLGDMRGNITSKRGNLPFALLDGGDVEALTGDIAHMERQAEALENALKELDKQLETSRAGVVEAQRAEALETLADCEKRAAAVSEKIRAQMPALYSLACELAAIRQEADAAITGMPGGSSHMDENMLRVRVAAITSPNGHVVRMVQTFRPDLIK